MLREWGSKLCRNWVAVLAWTAVGAPLLWGIFQTLKTAAQLFE
ncbi:MAG TPA: hypothetical protein VLT15_03995 [Acidimicrobiia bacterium]|nr:hypothetical protein [Acidimicrobiia bacterium]